jgi:hypothetical protein
MDRTKRIIGAVVLVFMTVAPTMAGEFDGSRPLIFAAIEIFECSAGGACQRVAAESINLPQFLRINFEEKTISGTRGGGEVLTTKILDMEHFDGKLILQGRENGRGWSMVIAEATGKVALTASDNEVGFVAFGACTPQ